jgi:hypothetical protein
VRGGGGKCVRETFHIYGETSVGGVLAIPLGPAFLVFQCWAWICVTVGRKYFLRGWVRC